MQIESGIQLFSRLKSSPVIKDLNCHLFPDGGPNPNNVVEITGEANSGKTYILTDLIAKCILPTECGGKNCGVALVNTDHHFEHFKLLSILERYIKKCNKSLNKTEIECIIMSSLKQLLVLDCYDIQQYKLTILNLEKILLDNSYIGLVAIDSICSYYWSERLVKGIVSMNKYMYSILEDLQKSVMESNPVIVYTKPSNFSTHLHIESTSKKEMSLGKVNYHISLTKNSEGVFTADVTTSDQNTKCNFKILNSMIEYDLQ